MTTTASTYTDRVHRVMDHIRTQLDGDLSLTALASVAGFSPHHFHRIFAAEAGETVAAHVRRARLERAVRLMRAAPSRTLSSIGAEVGFATPSDFSRVFRATYGRPPSAWDRRSRIDARPDVTAEARAIVDPDTLGRPTVVDRPPSRLAVVRVDDPWQGDHVAEGYDRLTSWLDERVVDWRRSRLVGMSWETALTTPLDRLTYDLGIEVGDDVEVTPSTDGLRLVELPAVRAVEVACDSLAATAVAWDLLYREWLPGSGWEPDDLPAMKRFRRPPERIDEAAWQVDCSIALRPLRP